MAIKNPKQLDDETIVDLIWQKNQAKYHALVREIRPGEIRIVAPRKTLIHVFREVYYGSN